MARMSNQDARALAAAREYFDWFDQQLQVQPRNPPVPDAVRAQTHAKATEMWRAFYRPLVNDPALADTNITLIADMFYGLDTKAVFKEFKRVAKVAGEEATVNLLHTCELALLDADAYTNPSRELIRENIIKFLPSKVQDRLNTAYSRYGSGSPMCIGMDTIDMAYNIWLAADPTYPNNWFKGLEPGCLEEILAKFPLIEVAELLGTFMHMHSRFAPAVSTA